MFVCVFLYGYLGIPTSTGVDQQVLVCVFCSTYSLWCDTLMGSGLGRWLLFGQCCLSALPSSSCMAFLVHIVASLLCFYTCQWWCWGFLGFCNLSICCVTDDVDFMWIYWCLLSQQKSLSHFAIAAQHLDGLVQAACVQHVPFNIIRKPPYIFPVRFDLGHHF